MNRKPKKNERVKIPLLNKMRKDITKREQRQINRLKKMKIINSEDIVAVKSINKQIASLQKY